MEEERSLFNFKQKFEKFGVFLEKPRDHNYEEVRKILNFVAFDGKANEPGVFQAPGKGISTQIQQNWHEQFER